MDATQPETGTGGAPWHPGDPGDHGDDLPGGHAELAGAGSDGELGISLRVDVGVQSDQHVDGSHGHRCRARPRRRAARVLRAPRTDSTEQPTQRATVGAGGHRRGEFLVGLPDALERHQLVGDAALPGVLPFARRHLHVRAPATPGQPGHHGRKIVGLQRILAYPRGAERALDLGGVLGDLRGVEDVQRRAGSGRRRRPDPGIRPAPRESIRPSIPRGSGAPTDRMPGSITPFIRGVNRRNVNEMNQQGGRGSRCPDGNTGRAGPLFGRGDRREIPVESPSGVPCGIPSGVPCGISFGINGGGTDPTPPAAPVAGRARRRSRVAVRSGHRRIGLVRQARPADRGERPDGQPLRGAT